MTTVEPLRDMFIRLHNELNQLNNNPSGIDVNELSSIINGLNNANTRLISELDLPPPAPMRVVPPVNSSTLPLASQPVLRRQNAVVVRPNSPQIPTIEVTKPNILSRLFQRGPTQPPAKQTYDDPARTKMTEINIQTPNELRNYLSKYKNSKNHVIVKYNDRETTIPIKDVHEGYLDMNSNRKIYAIDTYLLDSIDSNSNAASIIRNFVIGMPSP